METQQTQKLPHDNKDYRRELEQIHELEKQLSSAGFNYKKAYRTQNGVWK